MILIIKHIDIEGPGTLGEFLDKEKIPYCIIDLNSAEDLPSTMEGIHGVVVLGGPMNVDEETKYPWLIKENIFIQDIIAQSIPFLGICLGSQLLAKAAGAKVVKSPVKEIGWYNVTLTPEGRKDPLFQGFSEDDMIYHWHGDMFEIPSQGTLLATAQECPHQALKVGNNAYGLQFHIEITDKSIQEWCDEYAHNDLPGRKEHVKSMINDYWLYQKKFNQQAEVVYKNFLEIVRRSGLNTTRLDLQKIKNA